MAESLRKVLQRNLLDSLRRHELEEAERLLTALKEEDPLSVETRGLELEYLIGCKRFDEAVRLADQLVRLFPSSARIHYLIGRLAYAQKRYANAETAFRESDRIFPQWFTQLFLGKTLTQKGDFEEAESILRRIVSHNVSVRRDLSWLYERQGDVRRALQEMEAVLIERPNDEFAKAQCRRLRTMCLDPNAIVTELDGWQDLGEPVGEDLLPQYVDSLLRTGRGDQARQIVQQQVLGASTHIVTRTAWICYRLQAYDLALLLFLKVLPGQLRNMKLLSAMESAARRCQRLDELRAQYQQLAKIEPSLFGRLRRLQ
jgi:tetratricopeptide (TPR) repeat protein